MQSPNLIVIIQFKTLNYSVLKCLYCSISVSLLSWLLVTKMNTHIVYFPPLFGGLPGSILLLIDHSVMHYYINRMFYMLIKTKYERPYSEALTRSIQASAALKPEPGRRWKACSGFLGASKEGRFLALLRLNTARARNMACVFRVPEGCRLHTWTLYACVLCE